MADEATVIAEQPAAPVAVTEVPAAVVPPPAATTEVIKPNETRRETLEREMAKVTTERGKHAVYQPRKDGKFAGAPQFPVPVRPEMPKSLKLELKEHWEKTPVEIAAALIQRETDMQKGVDTLKTQQASLQTRAQQADDLLNEFKPYEMLLRMENSTPKQAVASLLQTAAILRTGTPVQKAQSVVQVMRQFGIPLEHLQQMLGGQGQPQAALDPQYNSLFQEVNQLKHSLSQRDLQQQQQSEARSIAAIQTFAANPDHVHFEAVQDRMLHLLQSPQVMGVDTSSMSDQDKLKLAYDTAVRLDPALYQQMLAAQQAKAQEQTRVAQAKNAATLVSGAPPSGPTAPVDKNDRRAVIAAAMASHQR